MSFPKADTLPQSTMRERSMETSPLKLHEELHDLASIPAGDRTVVKASTLDHLNTIA